MRRLLGFAVLFVSFAFFVPVGCQRPDITPTDAKKTDEKSKKSDPSAVSYQLELTLPDSSKAPDYAPERVSKLTVDGEDFSKPRGTERKLTVQAAKDNPTVKVVFSFWPNTYTNIIRTKMVKLDKDKAVKADLLTEDPATPDDIRPIYVPTSMEVTEQMCKYAGIGKNDVVYDIGCGDGRMVIMAVQKFGAKKGVGIDINEDLVKKCKENAENAGVSDKVEFRAANALEIKDFSEASVMLLYLGDFLNKKLQPTLKETLKPGSRVVSHRFKMAEDWPPDESQPIVVKEGSPESGYHLHLWRIK
jgi:precorrin-6B methylase 2